MPVERSGQDDFDFEFGEDSSEHVGAFDPATVRQLGRIGGHQHADDRDRRPELAVRAIAEPQDAVKPSTRKIDGLEARPNCERAVAQAPPEGREHVTCVVLGHRAHLDRVAHWLEPAPFGGYVGFAIGRTTWLDALREHNAGRLERDAAIEQTAANYRERTEACATGCRGYISHAPARAEGGTR